MLFKFLGLLIIGGGIIAGLTLVSQPQLLQEKAADISYATLTPRPTPVPSGYVNCGGQYCAPYNCHCVDGAACTRTACLNSPRPECVASRWTNKGCGEGFCPANQRLQVAAGLPSGCSLQARCISDSTCAVPTRTPTPLRTRTPSPRPTVSPTLKPGYVNCGGVSCRSLDCHCQGGDPCTGYKCEPNIRNSCLNQGRSWCKNMYGQAYTCCVKGYVCNTTGFGCVKQ